MNPTERASERPNCEHVSAERTQSLAHRAIAELHRDLTALESARRAGGEPDPLDAAVLGPEAAAKLAEPARVGEQVMPKVGGRPFRCECGCNVFTIIGTLRYRCNACQAEFVGEQDAPTPPSPSGEPVDLPRDYSTGEPLLSPSPPVKAEPWARAVGNIVMCGLPTDTTALDPLDTRMGALTEAEIRERALLFCVGRKYLGIPPEIQCLIRREAIAFALSLHSPAASGEQ